MHNPHLSRDLTIIVQATIFQYDISHFSDGIHSHACLSGLPYDNCYKTGMNKAGPQQSIYRFLRIFSDILFCL